jgi:putative hydrolase of the HAD superfamily
MKVASASPNLAEVEALLFDLGGVVFKIDFNRMFARWAAYAGEEPETIRVRFSFDTFYDRHERGEIHASEYFVSLRSSLRINLSDAQFTDGWTAIYLEEIPGVARLLRSLKDQIPLYAFTNSNPTHMALWANRYSETLKSFRRVFVSSDLGMRKPEPEAFAAIAKAIGISPDRILFFDDTKANIDGAMAVGMRAVHVNSTEGVADAIANGLRDAVQTRTLWLEP